MLRFPRLFDWSTAGPAAPLHLSEGSRAWIAIATIALVTAVVIVGFFLAVAPGP